MRLWFPAPFELMTASLLLSIALLAIPQQDSPPSIQQSTSGWCSPTIVGGQGNVTINSLTCNGVDPRAVEHLKHELNKLKLDNREALRQANLWAEKYHELEKQLSEPSGDTKLSEEAKKYLHEGKLDMAITLLEQIAKQEEPEVDRAAEDQYNLGLAFQLNFQFEDASAHLKKAYDYRPDNPKYSGAYVRILIAEHDLSAAEHVLLSALDRERERLVWENTDADKSNMAEILSNLGFIYFKTRRLLQAEDSYKDVLKIYSQMADSKSAFYKPASRIRALDSLGNVFGEMNNFKDAQELFRQALDATDTIKETSDRLLAQAEILDDQASWYAVDKDLVSAGDKYQKSIATWLSLIAVKPIYLFSFAETLNNLGIFYRASGQPDKAEDTYKKAIGILEPLAEKNPSVFEPNLAETLDNFGILYRTMDHFSQALAVSLRALEIRKRLTVRNKVAYEPDLAEDYLNVGLLHWDISQRETDPIIIARNLAESESAYEEAINIYRRLAKDNPTVYDLPLANTLNAHGAVCGYTHRNEEMRKDSREAALWLDNLGNAYTQTKDYTKADDAYQEALKLQRPLAKDNSALDLQDLASTLQNLSSLSRDRGMLSEALAYQDEANQIYARARAQRP
jgi:tetratricopeptide (TPR) repeat protein